ncbi:MAG: tetratricopeptide repeat protein [Bacteroidetes bacterium]|nr:tetratricopeptide repeat protein [Bacteroidota bacterium]
MIFSVNHNQLFKKVLFVGTFLFLNVLLYSQSDTLAVSENIELARAQFSKNPNEGLRFAITALDLAIRSDNKKFIGKANNTLGSAYYFLGNNDSAEVYQSKALEIQLELNDPEGLGRSYTNLGTIYSENGLNDKAIQYFLKAEKKFIEINYRIGLSKLYNSLGILFYNTKDFNNATRYYKNALNIARELKDETLYYSIATNLANTLSYQHKNKEALYMYLLSYNIAKRQNNFSDLATICNSICQQYLTLNNLLAAKKYDTEAMELIRKYELSDYFKISAFGNYGIILRNEGKYKEAILYLDSALNYAKESEDLLKQIDLHTELGQVLAKENRYSEALKNTFSASELKDSLYAKNLEDKLAEVNAVHNTEKKDQEISSLNSQKKNQKKINILLIAIVIVSVISLIIAIYSYIRKRKTNELISAQKQEVEAKNLIIERKQKEIIDSIKYAQRIQNAHLPKESYITKNLNRLRKDL